MAVVDQAPETKRRRWLPVAGIAATCLLVGGLVGFAWGSAAGDPTRQVTGVVDNVNDHAIYLTGVEGAEDGGVGAAFVANPQLEIHEGDTVSGTLVESDDPDRPTAFIVEKVVSPAAP